MAAAKGKSKEVSAAKGKAAAAKMGRVADNEAKLANMKKRSTSVRNKALASSTPSVKAPSPKSFNSAFAEAYKAGKKTFTYKGKKYTTAKKGSK
jgi:regulatory protein YycI of two-component signal transduction system YycFG